MALNLRNRTELKVWFLLLGSKLVSLLIEEIPLKGILKLFFGKNHDLNEFLSKIGAMNIVAKITKTVVE